MDASKWMKRKSQRMSNSSKMIWMLNNEAQPQQECRGVNFKKISEVKYKVFAIVRTENVFKG